MAYRKASTRVPIQEDGRKDIQWIRDYRTETGADLQSAVEAHDLAASGTLPDPPPVSDEVLQRDLAELLLALGMGDHARPQSPHEVFQEALGVLRDRLARYENVLRNARHAATGGTALKSTADLLRWLAPREFARHGDTDVPTELNIRERAAMLDAATDMMRGALYPETGRPS